MQFESSRHIYEKSSKIKFHENPCRGSRVVACVQMNSSTEGHRYDESNSRFL